MQDGSRGPDGVDVAGAASPHSINGGRDARAVERPDAAALAPLITDDATNQREPFRAELAATLLARGDAAQLKALDDLYGDWPGRVGWQKLCSTPPARRTRECETIAREDAPPVRDRDHDGIPDEEERCLGTAPDRTDTDGDGVLDAVDPAPTIAASPPDARTSALRALMAYVARFEEPRLWSIVVLDAPAPFSSILEGVAPVTLRAPPTCHFGAISVELRPTAPSPKREGAEPHAHDRFDATLHVDEISMEGDRATARVVFDYRYRGETRRYRLQRRGDRWRVVKVDYEQSWIQ